MTVNWHTYIVSDPTILLGKPVVKGTRISVELVIERLSHGETFDQIMESYPNLSRESILACLSYASASLKSEVEYPLFS